MNIDLALGILIIVMNSIIIVFSFYRMYANKMHTPITSGVILMSAIIGLLYGCYTVTYA